MDQSTRGPRPVGQRKGGGRFRAQPRDPTTGRRLNVTANSAAELQSRLARLRTVKDGLRYGDITLDQATTALRPAVGLGLTLKSVWERYEQGASAASHHIVESSWKYRLEPFFGAETRIHELTHDRMRAWEQRCATMKQPDGTRGYSIATIKLTWECLRMAVQLAIDAGEMTRMPWGRYRPKTPSREHKRHAVTTLEDFGALLFEAKKLDVPRWERGQYSHVLYAVTLMSLSAMRQAEAAGLGWDCCRIDGDGPHWIDINYQAPKGWLARAGQELGDRPTVPPKNGAKRHHELHGEALAALRAQREQVRAAGWYRDDGPVFPGEDGQWRRSGVVVKPGVVRGLAVAAGLPGRAELWVTHSLRHTATSLESIHGKGDLRAIADRTGHKDLRVIQTYIHAAGHGLTGSRIPRLPDAVRAALPLSSVETAPPAVDRGGVASAAALAPALPTPAEYKQAADERKKAERSDDRSWVELAREWVRGPRALKRPAVVTAAVKNAYTRAYQAAKYEGLGPEMAKTKGKYARRAALGAWGRAVAQAEREAEREACAKVADSSATDDAAPSSLSD